MNETGESLVRSASVFGEEPRKFVDFVELLCPLTVTKDELTNVGLRPRWHDRQMFKEKISRWICDRHDQEPTCRSFEESCTPRELDI